MAEFSTSVAVAAEPAVALMYLSDLTRLGEWDSSVRSVSLVADTGPAVGRRYEVVVGFYGKQLDTVCEVTEFDAGRRVAWSIEGRADGSTVISVEPNDTGSTVHYRTELRMRGLARLLDGGLKAALEGIGENIAAGIGKQLAS